MMLASRDKVSGLFSQANIIDFDLHLKGYFYSPDQSNQSISTIKM